MNVGVRESKMRAARVPRHHGRVLCLTALILLGIALCAAIAPHAAAQGCAMCYQNAASSGTQGRAALRHGILILLLPALALFIGIFVLIYRRRNPADFDRRVSLRARSIRDSAARPTKIPT